MTEDINNTIKHVYGLNRAKAFINADHLRRHPKDKKAKGRLRSIMFLLSNLGELAIKHNIRINHWTEVDAPVFSETMRTELDELYAQLHKQAKRIMTEHLPAPVKPLLIPQTWNGDFVPPPYIPSIRPLKTPPIHIPSFLRSNFPDILETEPPPKNPTYISTPWGVDSLFYKLSKSRQFVSGPKKGSVPTISSAVIVERDGKILGFMRSADQAIGFPCGKVIPKETYHECAVRECLEETGFTVSVTGDPPFVDVVQDSIVITYKATLSDLPQVDPTGKSEGIPAWVEPTDFKEGIYSKYNLKALRFFGYDV